MLRDNMNTTTTTTKKPSTLLDYLKTHKYNANSNKAHNKAVDILKVTTNNGLPKVNAVLVKSPMDNGITILHHLN